MSISSKLEWLDGTKDYIRQCIQQKGVIVDSSTTFRQYGDKILEIETEQHPPDWEGPGGGEEGTGQLIEGTALATGQDFILSPPEGYDGFNQVNVVGDYNLKPENIAAGVTIYGVTGTMTPQSNMIKIPPEYEGLFAEARQLYDGDYSGLMILEQDDAVAFGFMLNGFNIESYDDDNTEFTASRWVYVAYNKVTKVWKKEDWTSGTSNGNSYIRNIRYCDRYLYYQTKLVYPFISSPDGGYDPGVYEFSVVAVIDRSQLSIYGMGIGLEYSLSSIIDWGDNTIEKINDTSSAVRIYHTYDSSFYDKSVTVTLRGYFHKILLNVNNTDSGNRYRGLGAFIKEFLTPFPKCLIDFSDSITPFPNKFVSVIPDNLFSLIPDVQIVYGGVFKEFDNITNISRGIFSYNGHSVKTLTTMFYKCTKLVSIEEGVFDSVSNATMASMTFEGCTSLISVPSKLLANKPYLTSVYDLFRGCSSLLSVPSDIFLNSTNINDMMYAFEHSGIRTIDKEMFPVGLKNVNLNYIFNYCSNLTSIPEDIFDNIESVKSMSYAFANCALVSGKVPEFWNEEKYGTKFTSVSHDKCFSGCTRASNYNDIPNGWK